GAALVAFGPEEDGVGLTALDAGGGQIVAVLVAHADGGHQFIAGAIVPVGGGRAGLEDHADRVGDRVARIGVHDAPFQLHALVGRHRRFFAWHLVRVADGEGAGLDHPVLHVEVHAVGAVGQA